MSSEAMIFCMLIIIPLLALYYLIGLFVCLSLFNSDFPHLCIFIWPILLLVVIVRNVRSCIKETWMFLKDELWNKEKSNV